VAPNPIGHGALAMGLLSLGATPTTPPGTCARWIGLPAHASDRDAEILAAVKHLPERSTMPAMMHHAH